MTRFRKKPVVIEATRWLKNGDHPEDGTATFLAEGGETLRVEGAVVRYYRHPQVPGAKPCEQCGAPHDVHGWIDTGEGQAGPSEETLAKARKIYAAIKYHGGTPEVVALALEEAVRWDRAYLVSCPWCFAPMNGDAIGIQMPHVIRCGDRKIGEERESKSAALRASEAALAEARSRLSASRLNVESAEERLATMTKERDELEISRGAGLTYIAILEKRVEAARAEATKAETQRDAAREALQFYGRHRRGESDGCEWLKEGPCTCGLEAAIIAAGWVAAIRAPQPPEPETWFCANENCGGHTSAGYCPVGEPPSPPPPSASGLLLTLKRAANLLDCGAALRTSECSPADPCAACLVHADVEAEIRKLEAPPPSEEPRACPDDGFPLNDHCLYERGYYGVPEPCVNNRMEHHAASYSCRAATPEEIKAAHKCDLVGGDGGVGNCDHFGTVPSPEPPREER